MGGLIRVVLAALLLLVVTACASPPVIVVAPPAVTAAAPAPMRPGIAAPRTGALDGAAREAGADRGLDDRTSTPACDGRYVVILKSVVDEPYAPQVRAALGSFPDAKYVRTDESCSSLRARSDAGAPIVAVYEGPFGELADACDRRAQVGDDAYVKIMDRTTPAGVVQSCVDGTAPVASSSTNGYQEGVASTANPYGCDFDASSAENPCMWRFADEIDADGREVPAPITPAQRWAVCHLSGYQEFC